MTNREEENQGRPPSAIRRQEERTQDKEAASDGKNGASQLKDRKGRDNIGGWRKQKGEMAEAAFLEKAVSQGLGVAKPWGDSRRYDFIVDARGRLWRVQVKSAFGEVRGGGYGIRAHGAASDQVYTEKDIDVLVAFVEPQRAWYVIPIGELEGRTGVKLFPIRRRQVSMYEKWREAWEVFDGSGQESVVSSEESVVRTQ